MSLALRQGTPAWREARKSLITATDIPVLLGLSPYKCEADLADEKRGLAPEPETNLRMRIGSALEDLIAAEYERATGYRTRRWAGLAVSKDIEWAAASPDRRRKGALVELKWTGSRSRFADGLPQDVEAQVAWQLGVTGYGHADIAVLVGSDEFLAPIEVDADPALFANLVTVAADFRRRLAEGGPFSRDLNRIKRDYPTDNGAEMLADGELDDVVKALVDARATRKRLEVAEGDLERRVKERMGEIAVLRGDGWHVTWKRTKEREETDWRSLAAGLLRQLPETEAQALVGIHSSVREGFRPFRLVVDKEDPA